MICLYIINEEPAYIAMFSHSLSMLRKHNPNLKVILYFILDDKKDTRPLGSIVSIRKSTLNLPNDRQKLINFCKENNVEIRFKEFKDKNNYAPLHRVVLKEVEEKTVLLLDVDTFIYGNIENFPSIYSEFNFVATPNCWGKNNIVPGINFRPFNSGVVLCQNGIFTKWMETIQDYCENLLNGKHPLSSWLKSVNPSLNGREELASSLFVYDYKVSYSFFEDSHVITGQSKEDKETLIWHTLSPYWLALYNKHFNNIKIKKVLFRPIIKK